jgi:hypothetical protein
MWHPSAESVPRRRRKKFARPSSGSIRELQSVQRDEAAHREMNVVRLSVRTGVSLQVKTGVSLELKTGVSLDVNIAMIPKVRSGVRWCMKTGANRQASHRGQDRAKDGITRRDRRGSQAGFAKRLARTGGAKKRPRQAVIARVDREADEDAAAGAISRMRRPASSSRARRARNAGKRIATKITTLLRPSMKLATILARSWICRIKRAKRRSSSSGCSN